MNKILITSRIKRVRDTPMKRKTYGELGSR